MKHYELTQIANYLTNFKDINSIERVEDMVIKICFDRAEPLFFDLTRSSSAIFYAPSYTRSKIYQAPFDTLLKKHFTKATIKSVEVEPKNRILTLHVETYSPYKPLKMSLIFEFTGRNTNVIMVDSDGVIQEALRHIDSSVSSRSVKVGEVLEPLFEMEFKEQFKELVFPEYFSEVYEQKNKNALKSLKEAKTLELDKKIKTFQKFLDSLEDEEELQKKAKKLYFEGDLILSNLASIKPYELHIELTDFNGVAHKITFPKLARSPQEGANQLFKLAKKTKQKAQSLHIQRDSLSEKLEFLNALKEAIESSQSAQEINILLPKKSGGKKKQTKNEPYESFFYEGFKIMVGKSEKSNALLLKEAKKNDLWFHLKDMPSSHVILRSDKQNIPLHVKEFCAKLVLLFTSVKSGSYLVDFTKRSNVKVVEGSFVNYVNFDTIKLLKE